MSLDTLLHIGHTIRKAGKKSLGYYSNIEKCPKQNNIPILYLSFPLDRNYRIQWDKIDITPENQRDNLYYLKYNTSDKDSLNKYMYGDILYGKQCTVKEDGSINNTEGGGYYRLPNKDNKQKAYHVGSFLRAKEDAQAIISTQKKETNLSCDSLQQSLLERIRNGLMKDINYIEIILNNVSAIHQYWKDRNLCGMSFFDFVNNNNALYEYSIKFNDSNLSEKDKKNLGLNNSTDENRTKDILFKASTATIFIHFVFPGNISWYDVEDVLKSVQSKLQEEYVDNLDGNLVFKKTLYHAICSGNEKNDIQFPKFKMQNRHKSSSFSEETLQDIFYAKKFWENSIYIAGDIQMIVLPLGKNLTIEDYILFEKNANETNIINANEQNDLSAFWEEEENKEITSFDLIFCRRGSNVISDILEITQIERSHLFNVRKRLNDISIQILKEEKVALGTTKELVKPSISYALKEILGVPQVNKSGKLEFKTDKRYLPHLLKILPQIYMGTYYNDDCLLSSFIENVEYSTRAGQENYLFLKYDLLYLLRIQNNKIDRYMEMKESESYQAGILLGRMSKPLGRKINSFQKNYVGLLTRRASTKEDTIVLTNDIVEKLVMHNCYVNQATMQAICNLRSFDKELFAFGFFEGYFTYEPNTNEDNFIKQAEKIVNDYSSDEKYNEPLAAINEAIEIVKAIKDKNNNNE